MFDKAHFQERTIRVKGTDETQSWRINEDYLPLAERCLILESPATDPLPGAETRSMYRSCCSLRSFSILFLTRTTMSARSTTCR